MADALAGVVEFVAPAATAIRRAADVSPGELADGIRRAGRTAADMRAAAAAIREFQDAETAAAAVRAMNAAAFHDATAEATERAVVKALGEGRPPLRLDHVARLFDALAAELDHGRPEAVAVTVERERDKEGGDALRVRRWKRPEGVPEDAALLHADGTGDHAAAEASFGPLRLAYHPVERRAHVIYVDGHSFGKAALTGELAGAPLYGRQAQDAARLREDVRAVVARYPGCAVLTYKGARGENALDLDGLDCVPGHLNNIRGKNEWKGCETAVIAGRILPPMGAVEDRARALAAAKGEPFTSLRNPDGTWPAWPEEARALRMRDGTGHPVRVKVHPDPNGDVVLRQMRDAEAAQAIDRLRLIHCAKPKTVILMGDALPDATVDVVVPWKDFRRGGTRPELALRASGFLPLSARQAVEAHPEIWTGLATAQRDLDAIRNAFHFLCSNSTYVLERISEGCRVHYRPLNRKGKRGPKPSLHEALVTGPAELARRKVEGIVGPLAEFEVVEVFAPTPAEREVADDDAERMGMAEHLGGLRPGEARRIARGETLPEPPETSPPPEAPSVVPLRRTGTGP